ncbi:ATP-binding protein [Actinacidiphila sp. ITFR-21]|uniref:ATP-binding protein n=1 Tax=Actinacidiphila sp. ITFR-21 TaxID=3075199 RepID=UPI00288B99D3|nr:ATP-binding protein [Streptomyces sp. ITFR-21]WNI14354.1 ATP-binding protein [Streptomyces sp. ITFR-21]
MSATGHGGAGRSPTDGWSPPFADGIPVGAADVRQRVRLALLDSGEHCDQRPREDALLVASELATNAVRHGGGITGFQARVVGGVLVLAISDRVDDTPRTLRRLPGDHRPGGYGWPIIQRLARGVVVEPRGRTNGTGPYDGGPAGKTITVTLPLS